MNQDIENIIKKDEWEKEFFKKFGANTIWSKPSKENVETILDIWSFIISKNKLIADEVLKVVVEKARKLKKLERGDTIIPGSNGLIVDTLNEKRAYNRAINDLLSNLSPNK